jgi:hypothetical protein
MAKYDRHNLRRSFGGERSLNSADVTSTAACRLTNSAAKSVDRHSMLSATLRIPLSRITGSNSSVRRRLPVAPN